MSININLTGFCDIQKDIWENKIKLKVEDSCKCLTCGSAVKMISKWRAVCVSCGQNHTIKKPKNFPKNMDKKSNWKSSCDECSGVMDYYENKRSGGGAYICRKCSNVLEV